MARYDEDLHENEFFRTLVSKHTTIFNEAAEKKLLVSAHACAVVQTRSSVRHTFYRFVCQGATLFHA